MIVECPHCRAAHSKPEREAVPGSSITCRRCGKSFTLPGGVGDVTVAPGSASGPRRASAKIPVTDFHQASTEIMQIPASIVRDAAAGRAPSAAKPDLFADRTVQASPAEIKKQLQAMKGGEETVPGESLLVPAPAESPPKPEAEKRPAAAEETRVSTVGQIRQMLDRVKGSEVPTIIDEQSGFAPRESPRGPSEEVTNRSAPPREPPAGLVVEPSVPGVGLMFDDEPPRVARPAGLPETARAIPTLVHAARWPRFPTEPLVTYAVNIHRFVMAQSAGLRIGILAGAGVLVVSLLIIGVWLLLPVGPETMFVDDHQSLMCGPGGPELYAKVGEVQRGEPVMVYKAGGHGGWAMVRDFQGRVGYLSAETLSTFRPLSRAGVPFVACRQAVTEPEQRPCQARAQVQFDSCRDLCKEESDERTCLEQCQRQLSACIEGCEGKNVAAAAAPAPAPSALEQPATDADADLADHDKAAKKSPKPVKKTKKPKKK